MKKRKTRAQSDEEEDEDSRMTSEEKRRLRDASIDKWLNAHYSLGALSDRPKLDPELTFVQVLKLAETLEDAMRAWNVGDARKGPVKNLRFLVSGLQEFNDNEGMEVEDEEDTEEGGPRMERNGGYGYQMHQTDLQRWAGRGTGWVSQMIGGLKLFRALDDDVQVHLKRHGVKKQAAGGEKVQQTFGAKSWKDFLASKQ